MENADVTERIDELRESSAAVRFLSLEPLIGPLPELDLDGIHWVIVGGESGHNARPMKEDWALDILKQCKDADVPFFFKQWGSHNAAGEKVGKGNAGRTLAGQTWDEMPPLASLPA